MAVAGVDIGAVATKVAILAEGKVLSFQILPSGYDGNGAARRALRLGLEDSRLDRGDIDFIVSTGYGRKVFSEANKSVTEITAHAEGAKAVCPSARTILDIGGQDSKAISLTEDGQVANFVMNDRCAAGTGRFIEVMARVLHVRVAKMGELSLKSANPARINSMCTVFSESEVISLLTNGRSREDVAGGLCESIARRVSTMVRYVGVKESVVFSGGVAKNVGMIAALEKELKTKLLIPPEPQIIGAFGAAKIAQRSLEKEASATTSLHVEGGYPVTVVPSGPLSCAAITPGIEGLAPRLGDPSV
ncbi:MAG: acyl-CoA dehydratase activase [Thaumarchaeota archaeon]|nr:acyl-CoA dehydratase activase [Nitrososphaerota archaeon]